MSRSRKLNGQLEKAIQEAMAELDRVAESREKRRGVNRMDTTSLHKIEAELADINGNSSKPFLKSIGRNNNNNVKISEIPGVQKSAESKVKSWNGKRENLAAKSGRNGVGSVVKIAPHPGASQANCEVTGRLRSSQQQQQR